MGLVNPRESVRNDAIMPSVSVFMPVRPRFGVPAMAIVPPMTAMMTYCR